MAKVKLKKAARKTSTKKTPVAKKTTSKASAPMNKKSVNKSQAIRDYMSVHPEAGPNAVSEALKKDGIDVTPAFVSTVKSMDRRRSEGGVTAPAPVSGSKISDIPASDLLRAKKLAAEFGGVARARAALDALAQIVD